MTTRRQVLAGAAALGLAPVIGSRSVITGKVTRSGTKLLLNGNPYRMIGFNMWSAAINTWNKPANGAVVLNAGTTLDTWLAHIRQTAPHVNTIRCWFFQQFALHNGVRDWSAFDKVLSVCAARGFKVVPSLEDNWDYERNGTHDPALSSSWFQGGYKTSVRQREKITYRAWVQDVVNRYKGDPRIAMWELCNEPNAITYGFVRDVSGLIKSIDSATLVGCGEVGPLSSSIYALPTVDLATYHYYSVYHQTGYAQCAAAAYAQGKPTLIGEIGIPSSAGLSERASQIKILMASMFSTKAIVGFLYWQYAESGGDQFNIKSGDPGLPIMDSYVL
jgi:mannan endo-1,4-beta-mannosidase